MYGSSATYRGSNLPAYTSDNAPLFGRRRKGTVEWERVALLSLATVSVLFFVGVLYQGSRLSLVNLEKEQLEREIAHFSKEAASLRASLSNHQQEKSLLEAQLEEALARVERGESSLTRANALRETLQAEIREINAHSRERDRAAKKREEDLRNDISKLTQERNDLQIRVDTEDSTSTTWARKLAEEQRAKEACQAQLKIYRDHETIEIRHDGDWDTIAESDRQGDVDLGRKGAEDVHQEEVFVEVGRDGSQQKHRMDLER